MDNSQCNAGTLKEPLENLFDNSLPALLYILVLPPPAAAIFGCPEMSIIPLEITLPGFVFHEIQIDFSEFFSEFFTKRNMFEHVWFLIDFD